MVTTDFRTIEFRTTPEGRNAAIAKLEAERQAEYDRILRQLDTYPENVNTGGRPLLCLPPEIAQRVLADVDGGMSLCAIERKYKQTPYRFSRRWLTWALADDRLQLMAYGKGVIVGRNTGVKAFKTRDTP